MTAPYGWCVCDPSFGQSCRWCTGDAADDRERRRGGWRAEEPRRLTDAQWQQWLAALRGQAEQAPLREAS
jgi:hypothetical protein